MHLLVFYASYENARSELNIYIMIGDMESYLILRIGENETVLLYYQNYHYKMHYFLYRHFMTNCYSHGWFVYSSLEITGFENNTHQEVSCFCRVRPEALFFWDAMQ
jgi:hypothetical protein